MIKIIWAYWDGPTDKLLDVCLDSWKEHLCDWDIRILDKESIEQYDIVKPLSYDKQTITTKSDIIRLNLLYKYGGIWLDRSILLNESFKWLEKYEEYPYFGIKLTSLPRAPGNKDEIVPFENWFIMSPKKNNYFIGAWRDTLNEILDTNPITAHPVYDNPCCRQPDYFMCYEAFVYTINQNDDFKKLYKSIPFIVKSGGYINKSEGILYSPFYSIDNQPFKLTKFTSSERKMYKYIPYPYVYVLLLVILLICFMILKNYKRIIKRIKLI